MEFIEKYLQGGDLRSIGISEKLLKLIKNQKDFDILFNYLNNSNRLISMRAADAIEKITIKHPQYLKSHKKEILQLTSKPIEKELKWHLALLIPRLNLTIKEIEGQWEILQTWASNTSESKIVRVNSLQALYELSNKSPDLILEFNTIINQIESEKIPSINARIRKFQNSHP